MMFNAWLVGCCSLILLVMFNAWLDGCCSLILLVMFNTWLVVWLQFDTAGDVQHLVGCLVAV